MKNNECFGCSSFQDKRLYCKMYIESYSGLNYKIFKERFCPCKKCIVKPICKDVKLIKYKNFRYRLREHSNKCKILKNSVNEYLEYITTKKIRETKLKRIKRKSKK